MSLRGKAKVGGGKLKKLGKKAAGGLAKLSGLSGLRGVPRRRRSRGITARQFRTTVRVLKRITKMYAKLPRRASHHASPCSRRRT